MFPPLYPILDAAPGLTAASLLSFADKLASAGVELMQLRAKLLTPRQFEEISRTLIAHFAPRANVRIILNDRPDIASMVAAQGVHVGQEDLSAEDARKICPPPQWVGVSTHNIAQLQAANRTSADYIAVGPIFPTATKQNPDPVVGLDFLRAARKLTRKPLVAIGGITVQSAGDVFRAGADSVAVISDLQNASDPAQRASEYLAIAQRAISGRSDC